MIFEDRTDAGRVLAASLGEYSGRADVLVLALPRGGVPVGYEVARELAVPLDVFVVRKLGVPGQEELAMGAIASGGVRVLNREVVDALAIPTATIDAIARREQIEVTRRETQYRGSRPPVNVRGKIVILVDDGLATGSTMRAAGEALRRMEPAKIVIAVPVAAAATCNSLRGVADEVICTQKPEPFFAVGQWYQNFEQITDGEVRHWLEQSAPHPSTV